MTSALLRIFKLAVFFIAFFITTLIITFLALKSKDKSSYSGSRATEDLKLVVVVSRHGNLGGDADYPTDKYPVNDSHLWPYGLMELTPFGRAQMYALGAKVRSLYNGFINSTFYPRELYAASTVTDMSVISGEMFLAGLYPASDYQQWYKDVSWQPVSLYTSSLDNSVKVLAEECAAFSAESTSAMEGYVKDKAANISSLNQYIYSVTGVNQTGLAPLKVLWNKLLSEVTEGYTDIPEWTSSIYPEPLHALIGQEYVAKYANTDQMVRLVVGDLFEEMLDLMNSKINGSLSQSMHYYSGHDSSIIGLQVILGLNRTLLTQVVVPGSAMVFELHHNSTTNQYTLEVLYINGTASDLEPINISIPDCGDPCDFYRVVKNSRTFTDVDFNTECQLS